MPQGSWRRIARAQYDCAICTFVHGSDMTDADLIDVTMPVYRCRGCGKPQLRSRKEIRSHAPAALVRALGSAGIGQG